jgi:hypothetical protein
LAECFEGQAHAEGKGVLEDCFFVVCDDFVHTSVALLKDLQLRVGQLFGDGGVGAEVDSLGDVGADEGGDIQGAETEMPMENKNNKGSLLTENGKLNTNYFLNNQKHTSSAIFERVPILDKTLMINEEFDKMLKSLNEIKK